MVFLPLSSTFLCHVYMYMSEYVLYHHHHHAIMLTRPPHYIASVFINDITWYFNYQIALTTLGVGAPVFLWCYLIKTF